MERLHNTGVPVLTNFTKCSTRITANQIKLVDDHKYSLKSRDHVMRKLNARVADPVVIFWPDPNFKTDTYLAPSGSRSCPRYGIPVIKNLF